YGYHPVITNLLTSVTNALGYYTLYTHDTNTMKVTSISFPGGMVRDRSYYSDGPSKGFLASEIDEGYRTNTFSYTNGNVRAWTNELGLVGTFEWDLLNRMRLTSYPDGSTVSNHYENLDLVEVKDRLNHWTKYTFNEVRQLTGETNANGAVTVYDYCGCGSPA